ncbi:MAG: glycoside hydrolase family 3 C-terminal domain-containing protein [bacterium]
MKKIICLATVFLIAIISSSFNKASAEEMKKDESMPFWNTKLSFEERAKDLLSRLTLEEKVSLLSETEDAIPRLGVSKYYLGNEALHGVVRPGAFTVFPMAIALAATWDPDLLFTITTAISDEARGKTNLFKGEMQCQYCGLLTFWSPTINIARDPRWGRTPETYGEDPYLTGRLAVSFVKGLQGNDPKYLKVVSTPKHYAANNEDHNRSECNAKISERSLREYYLPHFRDAIVEGGAYSIMGAYNAINAVPCNANKKLMTEILRDEWGFNGFVVTDCGAVGNLINWHKYSKDGKNAAADTINSGVDLECGGDQIMKRNLPESLKTGLTTQETIDRAAYRMILARMKLGMFDPPEMVPFSKISPDEVGSKAHQELARQASRESIVLLKNEKVGGKKLLPIDTSKIKTIAVVGPNANVARFGDYSGTSVYDPITPLMGIKNKVVDNVKVNFVQWTLSAGASDFVSVEPENLRNGGEKGLKAEYFNNKKFEGTPSTMRTDAKIDIDTMNKPPDPAIPAIGFSVRWTGKLVPSVSGDHSLSILAKGGARLYLDGKLIAEKQLLGKTKMKAGQPLGNSAFVKDTVQRVKANLALEAGREYDIKVEFIHESGSAFAKLEWMHPTVNIDAARAKELETIKNSDIALVFLGIGLDQEREGIDRADLDLPFDQREYIRQVYAANPKTVVILISGSPLSINWIKDNVPAIIEAWYPGEQGGNAIADVLFGDYNPAGRLPFTFFKSVDDLAPFDDYEVTHGRTYMYFTKEPLYPFGYGLSYSGFEYGDLSIDKKKAKESDTVNVSFNVKNTGDADGDEVVQLYIHNVESPVIQPAKQLRGFKRIHLKKGETTTVTLPLLVKNLAFWDDRTNKFFVEPGAFDILVGASSNDIKLKSKIEVIK